MNLFDHVQIFVPHTSHAYVNIGKTVWSNNFSCSSKDISKLLSLINRTVMAFLACWTICFLAIRKLPDWKKNPSVFVFVYNFDVDIADNELHIWPFTHTKNENFGFCSVFISNFHS